MDKGFGSFGDFGEPKDDLGTSEGLFNLAQSQGGAVAQVATELVHPKTSILSTVSKGFKNAFSEFIDIVSIPNQLVAGAISDKYTMGEAVKKNISTSDVIFGKSDPKASIYKKVGSFAVRLATDVLLDPTTYLTFGTGAAFKIGGRSTVMLRDLAAKEVGRDAFDTAVLNGPGHELLQYVSKVGRQADGTTAYKALEMGNPAYDMAEKELEALLKQTADAPLDQDFARDVLSKVFEKNPAIIHDYLDKGGIKYFGQTILSAQRLKSTFEMIPGMTSLDVITQQPRRALASLFNPAYRKDAEGLWARTPGGIMEMEQKWKDISLARADTKMASLSDINKAFDLNDTETRILLANVQAGSLPASKRLADAQKALMGFNEEEWKAYVASGNISGASRLENHVPQMLVNPKVKSISMKGPSVTLGATKERKMAKFVDEQNGRVLTGHKDELGLTRVLTEDEQAKIVDAIDLTAKNTNKKVDDLHKEIQQLASVVQDVFQGKVSDTTKSLLSRNKNLDKANLKQFVKSTVQEAGDLNVGKLAQMYAKENYSQGVKKVIAQGVKDLSEEALALLKEQVAKASKALPTDLAHLNETLAAAIKTAPKKAKSKGATNTSGEIKDLMAKIKLAHESTTAAATKAGVDKESLSNFIEGLRSAFIENPTGARKAIEAIIGKQQLVTDLMHELDTAVTGAKTELAGLPPTRAIYKDKEGNIFKKEAAPFFNLRDAEHLQTIEQTALRDPKEAQKMLDEIKADGFEIFDDNLVTALAARSLLNVKTITMQDMVKDFARTFGVEAESASDNFVRLGGDTITRVAGTTGDFKFHPQVAHFMEEFAKSVTSDDSTMEFLKSYDTLQNFWKASVTSVWPAFHGRNAISNVLQNYLDLGVAALNPKTHVMSSQLIHAQRTISKLQKDILKEAGNMEVVTREQYNLKRAKELGVNISTEQHRLNPGAGGEYIRYDNTIVTSDYYKNNPKETSGVFTHELRHALDEKFKVGRNISKTAYEEASKKMSKDIPKKEQFRLLNKAYTDQQLDLKLFLFHEHKDRLGTRSNLAYSDVNEKEITEGVIDAVLRKDKQFIQEFPEIYKAVATPELMKMKHLNVSYNDFYKPKVSKSQEKAAEILKKNFFTDVTGHTWSYGEIIQVAKNNNIAFTSRIVSASDAAGGPESLMKALSPAKTKKDKLGRIVSAPGRIGQDVIGRTIEEQSRLVNFITHLKQTGDVTMASRRTKEFLFDYSNLTNFERTVMKRILPFYTFTRKNLELQAKAIINTPGRIASEVHAFTTLGEVISGGETLTDEERDKLPDWVKSGMTVLTKKNGSQVNILRNFGTPLEAPFQQIQANQMLGAVSPLVRVPVELGSGYNFFAGKPLSEVTNASAFVHWPKFVKDMIGFTTMTTEDGKKWNIAMRPEMMHLITNLPPTPRVFSTLATMENQDLSTQEKTLSSLIGVKLSSFDLEAEQAKKEKELKRQLEDLLTNAKVTAKFTRTFIPKTAEEKASSDSSFKGF